MAHTRKTGKDGRKELRASKEEQIKMLACLVAENGNLEHARERLISDYRIKRSIPSFRRVKEHNLELYQQMQAEYVAKIKEGLLQELWEIARLAAQRMRERLEEDTVEPRNLPAFMGVSVEKAQLVGGDPTERVEVKDFWERMEKAVEEQEKRLGIIHSTEDNKEKEAKA